MLQYLFQKDNVNEIPVETLEQFAAEHPLFAPAQFVLAQKYRKTFDPAFEKQIQKTVLHFHNPLWLHYQLGVNETSYQETEFRRPVLATAAPVEPENPAEVISHDLMEDVVVHQEAEPSPSFATEVESGSFANATVTDEPAASISDAEVQDDKIDAIAVDDKETDLIAVHATPESPVEETIEDAEEKSAEVSNPLIHPLFKKQEEEEIKESKIHFDPFHTVDYFASQGIKISNEIKPEDRLGKQLKSFTEWLRTMRKLPEATVSAELEKIDDNEIQEIAAHSLDEEEVVTEAMAEVLTKQGREEQALEVYRKLSLLYPDKSAYFAAKIEGLKHS